jgi:hypothetical protein
MTVPHPSNLYEGGRNGYRSGGKNAVDLESDKKQDNGKKIKKKLHGVDLSLNVAIGSNMAILFWVKSSG